MALERFRSSVLNRSDGSILTFPPDAVFTPKHPGSVDIFSNTSYGLESSSTVQHFSLGTKLEDVWGRVYRYVEFGATIAQNSLVQAEGPDAVHDNLTLTNAVTAGDTSIVVTSPATGTADFIANEYAQGWVFSEKLVSGGAYPIASHLLWDISVATDLTVELLTPILTAIAVGADLSFVKSKYKEVIISPATTATATNVGANVANGAVDGDYGWVQTRGPAKLHTIGTVVIGDLVVPSGTAGAVMPSAALETDGPIIGRVMNVGPTGEWSLIDLCLE
jgi:hypothetical protein